MSWTEQMRRRNEEHPKILADLNAGMPVAQVAIKHDISRARVYQIRNGAKTRSKRK